MKETIKEMVELQKQYKQQRKTGYTGKRMKIKNWRGETVELSPSMAAGKARGMKWELRHYYIAYGFLRGKSIDQIEATRKEGHSTKKIESIMNEFGYQFKKTDEAA